MLLSGLSGTTAGTEGSKSAASQVQIKDDLNRFLKLLVTQLKNQDPLDPMDATEFTSQLVQFASVEQQIYQNANLEKLLAVQQSGQVASMVDFLGLTVEYTGNKLSLADGHGEFTYTLPANTKSTKINIKNANGMTVFIGDGETAAGKHTYAWDGRASGGQPLPEGTYTVTVTAFDALGKAVTVEQTMFGKVTGSGAENGEVSLFLGSYAITMDKVLSVHQPKEKDSLLN